MTSSRFVDLSQTFHDGMPGIRRKMPDGSFRDETVRLSVVRTHAESAALNPAGVGFETTEVQFPTAIATYIDAPYCRWPEMRDISKLGLDDVHVHHGCPSERVLARRLRTSTPSRMPW